MARSSTVAPGMSGSPWLLRAPRRQQSPQRAHPAQQCPQPERCPHALQTARPMFRVRSASPAKAPLCNADPHRVQGLDAIQKLEQVKQSVGMDYHAVIEEAQKQIHESLAKAGPSRRPSCVRDGPARNSRQASHDSYRPLLPQRVFQATPLADVAREMLGGANVRHPPTAEVIGLVLNPRVAVATVPASAATPGSPAPVIRLTPRSFTPRVTPRVIPEGSGSAVAAARACVRATPLPNEVPAEIAVESPSKEDSPARVQDSQVAVSHLHEEVKKEPKENEENVAPPPMERSNRAAQCEKFTPAFDELTTNVLTYESIPTTGSADAGYGKLPSSRRAPEIFENQPEAPSADFRHADKGLRTTLGELSSYENMPQPSQADERHLA